MRIVYGIQSTGKGHLSRFLGLKPFFDRDGHELLVIASGYEDPPDYFLEAVRDCEYVRFRGVSYVGDGSGGISWAATGSQFLLGIPGLLDSFQDASDIIRRFDPGVVVSDFDPITASSFVAPGFVKVGLSHQSILLSPGAYHPPGYEVEKFVTDCVVRAFTEGLDHDLGCHFYPANESCLPPIIREPIRDAKVENRGHILVYHTLPGLLEQIDRYAAAHADRRFIVYGYPEREGARNMHFEGDRSRFAADLAAADAYVGTAGFQSISEAFYLGKKIAVHPIKGQYEQIWNAAQLEHHGMGCWYGEPFDLADDAVASAAPRTLEEALEQPLDEALHRRRLPWFRDGARTCYERIIGLADAR